MMNILSGSLPMEPIIPTTSTLGTIRVIFRLSTISQNIVLGGQDDDGSCSSTKAYAMQLVP
jgi:hypothetical protein